MSIARRILLAVSILGCAVAAAEEASPADPLAAAVDQLRHAVGRWALEMVSVGADGQLWIMTGPADEETRYSQKFQSRSGATSQLRFTRFAVTPDQFESRLESTEDDGKTWNRGNHQVFRRMK